MEKEVKKSNKFPALAIYMVAIYILFFLFNYFTPESTECITDNWCISSKDDIWVYSFFQALGIILIFLGALFGFRLAMKMLASEYRRFLFAGFFFLLGAAGLFAYFKFVPEGDKMEFIHIPIVIGIFFLIGLGGLFIKRKKPQSNKNLQLNKRD